MIVQDPRKAKRYRIQVNLKGSKVWSETGINADYFSEAMTWIHKNETKEVYYRLVNNEKEGRFQRTNDSPTDPNANTIRTVLCGTGKRRFS